MSNWLSDGELAALGIKAGEGALVSRRATFYNQAVSIGEHSRIDDGCIIMGNVDIGRRVHVAPYCVLYGKFGITLGDYVGLGACTVIHTEDDDYSGDALLGPQVPPSMRNTSKGPVLLERGANCGTRCTVLAGVTMHEGAVAGAHSFVKDSIPAWEMWAGAPARFRTRRSTRMAGLMHELEVADLSLRACA